MEIENLSGAELAEFRKWYAEFDTQVWDRQFEADVEAGKLDVLGEAARRARRHDEAAKGGILSMNDTSVDKHQDQTSLGPA